ncbi:MAG: glutathione S-transferase family protein [Pseudomonadota bacterium]|nr:glutathione S-transferase family protein [Pseudomonadota bacterium]
MIDLYAAPTSNGLRAKIMLDETGLDYTLNPVNLAENENKTEEYLAINPMGLIPTIIDPDGPDGEKITLSQSLTILTYLAKKSGKFLPDHLAADMVFMRNTMSIATDMTGVLMAIMTIGRMKDPHQPTIDEFGARFNRYLKYWNGLLARQKYAGADELSIADFAFYPVIFRAKEIVPQFTQGCPNIDRWYGEVGARPGVQKGLDFS